MSAETNLAASDALYVMGGSQASLKQSYLTAAEAYTAGMTKKIIVLHRPGITHFDHNLRRNLSNNEWSVQYLGHLGVPVLNIEIIEVEPAFFGTLSEACAVSEVGIQRGFKKILIVAAPHHIKRTKLTFNKLLQEASIELGFLSSREQPFGAELIKEYLKLSIYRINMSFHRPFQVENFI